MSDLPFNIEQVLKYIKMGRKEEIISLIYGCAVFDTKEKAEELFKTICSSCKEFIPERWGFSIDSFNKKRIFSPENLDEPSEYFTQQRIKFDDEDQKVNNWSEITLERKKSPKLYYLIGWDKLHPGSNRYEIEKTYLKDKNNLKKWIEYSHKLFVAHEGRFGYISCRHEEYYKTEIYWSEAYNPYADPDIEGGSIPIVGLDKGIPGIFWGNYFNSFYVDWFGRDKFDTLPCVKKEILPNGAIFFTTAETPFDWNTEECKTMQKEVIEHLGKDAFFDMEGLRREIKEKVIKKGIKGVDYLNKIHELVKLFTSLSRVPEFLLEGITESFENQMKREAEIYVNIIKKQNNVKLNYTEKDLDAIEEVIEADIEIGHTGDYQGTIRVLGSYLGETLIRNFGGGWIGNDPQFNIPAVEINSIKFFPHAKVHKRFENGKSDSLTSFYKVVSSELA